MRGPQRIPLGYSPTSDVKISYVGLLLGWDVNTIRSVVRPRLTFPKTALIGSACLVALACSACGGPGPSTATVGGTFQLIRETAGPTPPGESGVPMSGEVEITSATGKAITFHVGGDGVIKHRVAPGTYKATARKATLNLSAPPYHVHYFCHPVTPVVVARSGHGAHLNVDCTED